MTLEEQIEIVESNIAEYGVCDITIEEYKYLKQQIRAEAIDEFVDKFKKRTQLRQMTKAECINTMRDLSEELKEQK